MKPTPKRKKLIKALTEMSLADWKDTAEYQKGRDLFFMLSELEHPKQQENGSTARTEGQNAITPAPEK